MRRSIATMFAALLVFVAFPNTRGQTSSVVQKHSPLRVKVGDRVRKGQLLGKVGNSGNSVGPHLHFQVSRGPELNAYDFVPHVYTSYWLSGYAHHGKPDPAKRRRIDFKVPTSGSFVTLPSR